MADGSADPHIRFNVAMCQAPAVADYLREKLSPHARSRSLPPEGAGREPTGKAGSAAPLSLVRRG
jgi:hypothetical protein